MVRTQCFHCQEPQVQFLVRELRFLKPHSTGKKEREKERGGGGRKEGRKKRKEGRKEGGSEDKMEKPEAHPSICESEYIIKVLLVL